ncbi:MAG: peroxiredoxin family protein [Endomicrobiia bacterium]
MKKTILLSLLFLTSISCAKTKKTENYKYIDFELQKLSSTETIKLSSFVGKNLILLNFLTTWCPYCVREIPQLKQLQEKYEDKGLKIIAVNIGEKETEVEKFVKKQDITYTVLLDLQGKVARQYAVRGIPTNFLINLKGEIIFAGHHLPDELLIERNLLKENKK